MSNKTAHPGRDFSCFDAMSTEELTELLRQDAMLPPEQETDLDAILYIMEVVAKREAVEHPEESPSTEAAWASFNALYRPKDGEGQSLYEDTDEEATPVLTAVPAPPAECKKPRKNVRFAVRAAIAAAVLIVMLVCGSLLACASGHELWAAVTQWTKDAFGFNSSSMPLDGDALYRDVNDPRDVLLKYGIATPLLPTWMPEGYEFKEIELMETPTRKVFYVWYMHDLSEIGITIAALSTTPILAHEQDEQNTDIYTKNGIDHYIITNLEETTIVWTVGTYDCSIRGPISTEDAQNIIDSIYRS